MVSRDIRDRREWRSQDQREWWRLDGECHGDAGPKGLPQVHDAAGIDIRPGPDRGAHRAAIDEEPGFGRRAPVSAVPAIVEQADVIPGIDEMGGYGRAETAVAGVAVEDDDGGTGVFGGGRHEPGCEGQAVFGRDGEDLGRRNARLHRRCNGTERQVQQSPLRGPDERQAHRQHQRKGDSHGHDLSQERSRTGGTAVGLPRLGNGPIRRCPGPLHSNGSWRSHRSRRPDSRPPSLRRDRRPARFPGP